MIAARDITGVILCGGRASRMGNKEKPLETLGDTTLVERVRRSLAPQVKQIVISANRQRERYAQWGDLVVADRLPDLGPLGGIMSSLEAITTPYAFCCPGDAPLLSATLVARLAAALEAGGADVAVPYDGSQQQHLFILLRTGLRAPLLEFIEQGGRAVHEWIDTRRSVVVSTGVDPLGYFNVNTEADLRNAQALLIPAGTRS